MKNTTHLAITALTAAMIVLASGCCTKRPDRVSRSEPARRPVQAPSYGQVYSTKSATERYDQWRIELEEFKQAQRDRYHRMEAKRISEQHAFPPEMPDIKVASEPARRSGPLTAADRMDDWQRRNAELELADQLREVRIYQLKVRHYLGLPPEWLEERSAR